MQRKIGTITLQKKTTFHYAGYECAAWWKEIECHPQTVELFYDDRGIGSKWLIFTFYGTRTADYFAALYCGVAVSNRPYQSREVGNADSHSFHMYDYQLIDLLLNRDYKVILDPDVVVTSRIEVLGREAYDWETLDGVTPKQSSFAHTAVFAKIAFAAEQAVR